MHRHSTYYLAMPSPAHNSYLLDDSIEVEVFLASCKMQMVLVLRFDHSLRTTVLKKLFEGKCRKEHALFL